MSEFNIFKIKRMCGPRTFFGGFCFKFCFSSLYGFEIFVKECIFVFLGLVCGWFWGKVGCLDQGRVWRSLGLFVGFIGLERAL